MATFDDNVDIQVLADASPVGRAGFGVPLVADAAGMSERIRYYTSAAAALADVGPSGITQAQADAIAIGFSQRPRPARIAAGRITAPQHQINTITIGGTPANGDYEFLVNFGGAPQAIVAYTATSSQSNAQIADGLLAEMLTIPALINRLNMSSLGGVLTLGGVSDEITFTIEDASAPGTGTITVAQTQAAVPLQPELTAIANEDPNWFGLSLVSRDSADILSAASWAEANRRLFAAQTSDAGVLAAGSLDVASDLKARNYNSTFITWHHDDSQYLDMAWLSKVLANDMDVNSTTWAYKTLAGVTPSVISETQKLTALGKNANLYLTIKGLPATGPGKSASGRWIDTQTLIYWTESRVSEAIAQLFVTVSNLNLKIPYTNEGFAQIEDAVQGVLQLGVRAGHFAAASANGFPPYVDMPTLAEIPDSDKLNRVLRFTFGAKEAGAVYSVTGTGYVLVSDDVFESLAINAGVEV